MAYFFLEYFISFPHEWTVQTNSLSILIAGVTFLNYGTINLKNIITNLTSQCFCVLPLLVGGGGGRGGLSEWDVNNRSLPLFPISLFNITLPGPL